MGTCKSDRNKQFKTRDVQNVSRHKFSLFLDQSNAVFAAQWLSDGHWALVLMVIFLTEKN